MPSDKSDDAAVKQALDLALAIAVANQTTNGQFETKLGDGNAVVSERQQ